MANFLKAIITFTLSVLAAFGVYRVATPKPTPSPIPVPQYIVVLLNNPDLKSNLLKIDASVKNISIKPYIVQIRLRDCILTDNQNNSYQGFFRNGGEYTFNKALLPNESGNAKIEDSFGIDGISKSDTNNFQKCGYDSNGYNTCTAVTGIKIVSCNAYVSTSWGGGNNDIPVTAKFP